MKTTTFLPRFFGLLLLGFFVLASPRLNAQDFISDPNNVFSGTSYFESDAEVNGNVWVDDNLNVSQTLSVGDSVNITNNLNVGNVYANNVYGNYATSFAITGNFELTSGFSPGMSESWGVANSWLHSSLDLGDLTYTSTDTPAFNISQNKSGSYYYPTIYFTGYDGNTTWVWQQNGLAAMSNSSVLETQMTLANSGNLTINNPTSGHNLTFEPQNGNIALNNTNGTLTVSDGNSSTISINVTGQSLTFFNATANSSASITPVTASALFSTYNSAGALGIGGSATGSHALAIGNGTVASGAGSFAIGSNVTAAYFNSIVVGQWNAAISGSGSGNTTWVSTDPLFVIGNGTSSGNLSNALVMLKNGNTTLNGNLTVNGNATFNGTSTTLTNTVNFTGNVSVEPQGDILMGTFGD